MNMKKVDEFLTKENLQILLKGKFGSVSIPDFTWKPAVAIGENFGSTLLTLDIKILNENKSQTLHVIAKLLPPTEFLCKVFNVEVTFCKEINFYKLVYPAFLELQYECGFLEFDIVNLVPPFYGAFTSFDSLPKNSSKFDAMLLLENMKVKDYECADRLSGLDLQHCEIVMKNLALFHALGVALKQKKPMIYEETLLKAASKFRVGCVDSDDVQDLKDFMTNLGKNVPECREYLDKIQNCLFSHINIGNVSLAREPFATLVHNDLWTNNILFKYEKISQCSIPYDIKFLDFQLTLCCSPVRDIIFFLFGSAQREVIENHYNYLIDVYYDNFEALLKRMKCDVRHFSKSLFLEEIDHFAPTQLFHVLSMLNVIYGEKDHMKDPSEASNDVMLQVGRTEICRKKIIDIVQDFNQRGWLREGMKL